MDTNSAIFTLFSITASALLLNSNCGIRGARQAQLAADGGQGHELAGRAARPAGMQTRVCELLNRGIITSY